MRTLSLVFASVVALASAARADAPKSNDMAPGDVAKLLALFDRIVDVVVADQSDCAKLAKDVGAVIDANKDVPAIARKAKQDGKRMPPAAQEHMLDGAKKMVPVMKTCGSNADVQAAFKKLDDKK